MDSEISFARDDWEVLVLAADVLSSGPVAPQGQAGQAFTVYLWPRA